MDNKEIKVLSVNTSAERGRKYPVPEVTIGAEGIQGDVHSGMWNRQISILDVSHAERFSRLSGGRKPEYGAFAENLSTAGLEDVRVLPFDRFENEETGLEVTQCGKPFHGSFREAGNYVMPREGIFCRSTKKGILRAGDSLQWIPKVFKVMIVTLSDRASKGVYEDLSGPEIAIFMEEWFEKTEWRYEINNLIIPDNPQMLRELLEEAPGRGTDIIITTGGTGIGPRDFSPEVVKSIIEKEIPGIMEMIRMKYGMEKPNALLSRSIAGTLGKSLIFALPGSLKAVKEYMPEILKTLRHMIFMLHAVDTH